MKTTRKSLATLLLASLTFGAISVALSGCAKKDDTPPPAAGYYTGPKAAKTPPPGGAAAKGNTEQ